MAKKIKKIRSGGDQPPFKFYYKLLLLGCLIIGLPLILFVTQSSQSAITEAENSFPSGGILGPRQSSGMTSGSSSKSCINGKCYSCSNEAGCSIQCANDSCTCEPGPCSEQPPISGSPSSAPEPSSAISPGETGVEQSGMSISCINGKCYSCEGSSGSCSVQCENENCTCEPGPCKEVASEISGIPLPGSGSAEFPQLPEAELGEQNIFQKIIDSITEFFKNLFK